MHWIRVNPLQPVSALIAVGDEAVAQAQAQLATKSALFRSLRRVEGHAWMALFTQPISDAASGESVTILPSIPIMMPLYEDAAGWWLPVGMAMAAPDPVRAELREALAKAKGFQPPVIVVPRFDPDAQAANTADIFELRH